MVAKVRDCPAQSSPSRASRQPLEPCPSMPGPRAPDPWVRVPRGARTRAARCRLPILRQGLAAQKGGHQGQQDAHQGAAVRSRRLPRAPAAVASTSSGVGATEDGPASAYAPYREPAFQCVEIFNTPSPKPRLLVRRGKPAVGLLGAPRCRRISPTPTARRFARETEPAKKNLRGTPAQGHVASRVGARRCLRHHGQVPQTWFRVRCFRLVQRELRYVRQPVCHPIVRFPQAMPGVRRGNCEPCSIS